MYYHQDDINGTPFPPVGDPTDFNIPFLANASPTSSVFPPLSVTKSSPFSAPSPSVFSVGLKRPEPQINQWNQWGNAATPHSRLPNGWPAAMAHVPHGQMVPGPSNMMKQINPPANPFLSLPYPPIGHPSDLADYDGSGFSAQYSDQSLQFFEPSFPASIVNASSSRSPSISTAFMGLRTPASRAIAYPPRRLFSPQFSISNNGGPGTQHCYGSSSSSMSPSNLRNYANPSIQSAQSSSRTHVASSGDPQTHVLRAVYHPRGGASFTPPTFSPSSMASGNAIHFAPPAGINNLGQGEEFMHQRLVARQAAPIPRISSWPGWKAHGTDRSNLLRGEIESDNYTTFNQVHKTGHGTSSKVRLIKLNQVCAQRSGRSPPEKREARSHRSQQSKPVAEKNTEWDYSLEYGKARKSMSYPNGLQWLSTPQVPTAASPTDLLDSTYSSLPPQEPKQDANGTSRHRSAENPAYSKQHPSTGSTSSAAPPARKRKRDNDGASHSTAPSSIQVPPAKRRCPATVAAPSSDTPLPATSPPSSTIKKAKRRSRPKPSTTALDTEKGTSGNSGQIAFEFEESPLTALALASASTSPSFPFPPPPPSTSEMVMNEDTISTDPVMEIRAVTFGLPKVRNPWVEVQVLDVDEGQRGSK